MHAWRPAVLALLLLSLPVLGEQIWVNNAGPYSVAVGASFQPPLAGVTGSGFTTTTATVEVIGGCGTLNGAARVEVTVTRDPPNSGIAIGPIPPFVATRAGVCSLRIGGQASTEIRVDVFNPQTLRLEPLYPRVTVQTRGTSSVQARVVDDGGRHAGGRRVRYDVHPSLCAVIGIVETSREATSDASGVAFIPSMQARNSVGDCPVTARLLDNNATATLDLLVFDPARANVSASPAALQAVLGDPYFITVDARDEHGEPLARQRITFRSEGGGGAAPSYMPTEALIDSSGRYEATLLANNAAGQYDVVVAVAGKEARVRVTQSPRGTATLPQRPTRSVQDMWWIPAESGWGLSVVQHGEKLFGVVYGYEQFSPFPTWWVMPSGTWNADHTVYTGAIYSPRGTSFRAYDASMLAVGPPVGTVSFTFFGDENMQMAMTLGTSAPIFKQVIRQNFGTGVAAMPNLGDMWWGGVAQNGWGVSVIQQGNALFAVWFTYGFDGKPLWYVMPAGTWTGNAYEGRFYITRGTGPVGRSSLIFDVGSYRLRFNADGTAAMDINGEGVNFTLPLQRQGF